MSGFQTRVNNALPFAVEGDFASTNPRASVMNVPGGLKVAAAQSVRVGYFAWAASDGQVYSSQAAAAAIGGETLGFVGRQANEPSALITTYLGESVLTLQAGMPVTLFDNGDFWANFAAGAAVGASIYATQATGAPTTTASTNPITKYKVATAAKANAVTAATTTIAAQTGIMTIATVASGVVEAGQRVTGTGVAANTMIQSQLTGVAGGAGTYQTTSLNRAAVAAFTATMVQGTLAKISSNFTAGT